MTKRDTRFLMAAVAGIGMAFAMPSAGGAGEKKTEVKCWGINSCGSKCSVTDADIKAFKDLFGEKDYSERWDKTEIHSCGAHAKCGVADHILNWVPASATECTAKNGYLVEEVGPEKKKVAKKA